MGRQRGHGSGLASARAPLWLRELQAEIDQRLAKAPTRRNEYGYDAYGLHLDVVRRAALPAALLYRHWFRVEAHDIGRVPPGRVLLVANHAGQLPFDALMLVTALLLEAESPRIVRPMGEYWIPSLPWFGVFAQRGGVLVGTPQNCVSMLEAGECVMTFPEGVRGMNKTFDQRYRLQRFGTGFLRLALETETPIVPVGVVGSEEQQPAFANVPALGRLLGMPAFPLTLGFPWLGPLGILPLPVKYHLLFGEPLRFDGAPTDDQSAVQERVDVVRDAIAELLRVGRERRRGIFF